jgi:hypothetical protein
MIGPSNLPGHEAARQDVNALQEPNRAEVGIPPKVITISEGNAVTIPG